MTPTVDDPEVLGGILAHAGSLLLDFDGPVCSVFAEIPASDVACQLRDMLDQAMSDYVLASDDPFEILRYALRLGGPDANYVEASLTAHEVEAVQSATPTRDAHELIRAWVDTGRRVAIVSNNSSAAVDTYLHKHKLSDLVSAVSARTGSNFRKLKPDPYLVDRCLTSLDVDPNSAVFIGDSLSDISAGRAVGVTVVGFANKPRKLAMFAASGAHALTTDLSHILPLVRS